MAELDRRRAEAGGNAQLENSVQRAVVSSCQPEKISSSEPKIKQLMSLLKNQNLLYGLIAVQCRLEDCILMDQGYVEDMEEKHPVEYLCGQYEPGRYAWILRDIKILAQPIAAKGSLGLWTFPK